jgi:hypothetical protein
MFDKTIKVSNMGQGTQFPTILLNGIRPPETPIGETDVPFVTWLEIKRTSPKPIENEHWYVDQAEENRLFELYRSYCFQEFELLGIPNLKARITLNKIQNNELFFAHEWLEQQELFKQKDKPNLVNTPIGYVGLGVIIVIVGALATYSIRAYLGISL